MSSTSAASTTPGSAAVHAGDADRSRWPEPDPLDIRLQEDLWLAWRLDSPDAPPRVDGWVVQLDADVRRDRIADALTEVVARREELRWCFPGECEGRVSAGAPPRLIVRAGPRDDDWTNWVVSAARESMNVERGPLAGVWWVGEGASVFLVVAVHELIGGAEAARVLLEELAVGAAVPVDRGRLLRWPGDILAPLAAARAPDPAPRAAQPVEAVELPLDRARPPTPGFCAHIVHADVSEDLARGVRSHAADAAVNVDDLWLAAVLAWIHRLTGAEAPHLGLGVGGGSGLVPVSVAGAGACAFGSLVRSVARRRVAAGDPGDAQPRPDAALAPRRRDLSRPWRFDVTVTLAPRHMELWFGERRHVARRIPRLHLDGDLAVALDLESAAPAIELRGNQDVFAADTLRRWLGSLCTLLGAGLHAPDTRVDQLEVLSSAEKDLMLRGWNPAPFPSRAGPDPFHLLFAEVARTRGDHAAVISDDLVLTYGALDAGSNRLAHTLIAEGVRPGDRVGLALSRSAGYAVATLAVLKAGAAFVPIDLEWPEERREFVLSDCAAVLVIHGGSAPVSGAGVQAVRQLNLATAIARAAACSSARPAVDVSGDDLAYVIYTSGTTGRPKGVMVGHRALSAHLQSIVRVYDLQPDDCGLLFHSVAFDPAIEQLFSPLVVGGTVRMRGDGLWTGREFSDFVRREGVTAVTLPPRYWLEIMREWESDPSLTLTGQLRRVLVGGEPLPMAVVELWRRLGLTSIRLLNGYGPTECTVTATVHVVPREHAADEECGRMPIGRPHGPVEAYVLDEQLQLQPIGVPGELCLAGPTLAQGYLGAEALTRGKFVPHPFRPGERLYRTGDRVRWLVDGTLDFCGRTDRQVKVGGFRIEPGEIEGVICGCDGVEACAVIPDTGSLQETILSAYVVARPGADNGSATWRERVRGALPAYMVPAEFFVVPALPRTINGKLDAAALRRAGADMRAAVAAQRLSGRGGARVPAAIDGATASRVAAAWCAVLGRDDVAPEDDFFEAGGHSLLAIALYARLEKEFSRRFALREWLGEPTFAALVRHMEPRVETSPGVHDGRAGWTFLFPIRGTGTQPRLFLFAGGRGCDEDFVVLAGLTRELGADQPVWGVRVGGPDRLQATHDDAWELAEDIAAEIRAFQPDGPYLLAGECIGGLLAFEVARVLERSGGHVAFLALINTVCPRPGEQLRWWLRTTWVGRARQEIPRLLASWKAGDRRGVREDLAAAWTRIAHAPASRRPPREDGMPDDPKDYFYGRLLLRYRPTPARLPLAFLACEAFLRRQGERRWAGFGLRGFAVVPVPGDTSSCLREHAAQTAISLRRALHPRIR